jgi:hypothetical protein
MILSEEQILANRRNAQLSTGPQTDQGKAISAQNAFKHGFRSSEVLIPGEDPSEFDSFRQDLLADLSPIGHMEFMLADRIIGSFWKLKRSGRMENELYFALMAPDYSEEMIEKEEPYEVKLTCTREDGSTYIDKHYSVSKTEGVKDLLKEPKPETPKPADSLKTLRSLGDIALQDFTSGNILARFRCYEGQIERSLYKALTELHRLKFLRTRNDLAISGPESDSLER